MTDIITDRRPRWADLNRAVEYSPAGRSTLYLLASQHQGLFRKLGGKIVVDLDLHDAIMASLPSAKIKQTPA
jgi:hypothetical protein